MAPYGSLWLCDQGMAEWSNNGDPDDYPPRWLSRALCKAGRICSACCARAASGQAAVAPPSSDMNSRRLIRSPRRRGRAASMALRGRARSSAAPATTKPPISNTVFIRLLCWASHDRASALRPETAHCRSLISHSRPAVSMSCASGLGGLCSWSEKYTPLTFATSGEVASHTRVSAPFSGRVTSA